VGGAEKEDPIGETPDFLDGDAIFRVFGRRDQL
jgi:hypothetical protein